MVTRLLRLGLVCLAIAGAAGCVQVCEPVDAMNPSDYRLRTDPERGCEVVTVFDVVGGLQQGGVFDGR